MMHSYSNLPFPHYGSKDVVHLITIRVLRTCLSSHEIVLVMSPYLKCKLSTLLEAGMDPSVSSVSRGRELRILSK